MPLIHLIKKAYHFLIIKHPLLNILILLATFVFFAFHVKDFGLDASADSLLLDDDEDLKILRELSERYASQDFLFIAFTPHHDLFDDSTLQTISDLKAELERLPLTDTIITLLDVPLVRQVEGSLSEVTNNYKTLRSDDVDNDKARAELLASPIFRDSIISLDGTTTALQVNLLGNTELLQLLRQRNALLDKQQHDLITADERQQLRAVSQEYREVKQAENERSHENILQIRNIMDNYKEFGTLHLGGVAMITDDMVTYIQNDLLIFGTGVLLFLVAMLTIIFRRLRWVILPLLSCIYAGVLMIGLLGFIGWDVTVISSNFISLMLIITMSMNIHLVVRYRQLREDMPDLGQQDLVMKMAGKMVWPCAYTALTTIMAFSSLVFSGIKPVIDFGWMMTIGLVVVFITTFFLLPGLLILLQRTEPELGQSREIGLRIMPALSSFTVRHGNGILFLSAVLMVISIVGVAKLEVENSFINYFDKDTDIYQGLKLIDDKLGGTTTLDIIIKFDDNTIETATDDSDEWGELGFGTVEDNDAYWFTPEKLDKIKAVHDYLDGLPAVGKVLSLASLIRVGEDVNQGAFDAFELAVVYRRMPAELKSSMIDPYISIADNEARISLRILDSQEDLRRKELLEEIHTHLINNFGFSDDQVVLSGLLVLYNNMLQSLFKSQILTLGVVMGGIFLMLLLLFRSITLAFIGIIPNILASAMVLGLMGLLSIPLDMMTITIAAITIGIAVDNSIHYIYRFREEFARIGDYIDTLHYCHANIGKAVFYNAMTIIAGFSILALSNFIPTIYFGLLTASAMSVALLAALTLLPRLILIFRPFIIKA